MFEAYWRNQYLATGVIQAKKPNEPLHVQYSYDDRGVVVVDSYHKAFAAVKVHAAVYNLDMAEKFSRDVTA